MESMFVAAHRLGIGTRIYGSLTGKINSNKDLFQIPTGYKAIIVLLIGNKDKTEDSDLAATPR